MRHKIYFSNIGYAKGIDGSLKQHVYRFNRHFFSSEKVQKRVLEQLKAILTAEDPDICCLVEVDQGSFHSAYYNQLNSLIDDRYSRYHIDAKYGEKSWLNSMPLHRGKSNAVLLKQDMPVEKLYFSYGTKRLVYKVSMPENIAVFSAHFSLKADVRARQFDELASHVHAHDGPSIILADFNIMRGFSELTEFMDDTGLVVLNDESEPTFTFYKRSLALDLCLCSRDIRPYINLQIIDQPFSDHKGLLVTIRNPKDIP